MNNKDSQELRIVVEDEPTTKENELEALEGLSSLLVFVGDENVSEDEAEMAITT